MNRSGWSDVSTQREIYPPQLPVSSLDSCAKKNKPSSGLTVVDLCLSHFVSPCLRSRRGHLETRPFRLHRKHLPQPDGGRAFPPSRPQSRRLPDQLGGRRRDPRPGAQHARHRGAAPVRHRHFAIPQPAAHGEPSQQGDVYFCHDPRAPRGDPDDVPRRGGKDVSPLRVPRRACAHFARGPRPHWTGTRHVSSLPRHHPQGAAGRALIHRPVRPTSIHDTTHLHRQPPAANRPRRRPRRRRTQETHPLAPLEQGLHRVRFRKLHIGLRSITPTSRSRSAAKCSPTNTTTAF